MNKKNLIIFASLMSILPAAHAFDPPVGVPQTQAVPLQRGRIKGHGGVKAPQSLEKIRKQEGKFSGTYENRISLNTPLNMIGKGKGPGAIHAALASSDPLPRKMRHQIEKICKSASKRHLAGDGENKYWVYPCPIKGDLGNHGLHKVLRTGTKVEGIMIPIKVKEALDVVRQNPGTPEAAEAMKAAKKENLKALNAIKNLAIDHLTVDIDVDMPQATQAVLKWVGKNPYGIKTIRIKTSLMYYWLNKEPLEFFLPVPTGGKFCEQKKLHSLFIYGEIDPTTVSFIEKYKEIKDLRLEGTRLSFPEEAVRILARAGFSNLEKFSARGVESPIFGEPQGNALARGLKVLHLSGSEISACNKGLLDFSSTSFPALEEIKLSHFNNNSNKNRIDPLGVFLQKASELEGLKSFHADLCGLDLSSFSAFLERLGGRLKELHLEKIIVLNAGNDDIFYQLTPQAAEKLESLTVKNCRFSEARLTKFFDKVFSSMRSLNLSRNGIEMEDFKTVFSKPFLNLEELNLSGNYVWNIGIDFLMQNCEKYPNLKSLVVSNNFFNRKMFVDGPNGEIICKTEAEYREEFGRIFPGAKIHLKND